MGTLLSVLNEAGGCLEGGVCSCVLTPFLELLWWYQVNQHYLKFMLFLVLGTHHALLWEVISRVEVFSLFCRWEPSWFFYSLNIMLCRHTGTVWKAFGLSIVTKGWLSVSVTTGHNATCNKKKALLATLLFCLCEPCEALENCLAL